MIAFLREQPLIVLFLVAAIGYPLGLVRVGGSSLGVAAVLFVGLAVGALDPDLKLPEIVYQIGLVLFVYTIGLSSGPGFFRSLKRKGLRDNLFVATMVLLAAVLAIALHSVLGLRPAQTAGLYAGSLTNTPALASVLEYLKLAAPAASREQLLAEPVVGYSIAYPMGVIGMIVAIALTQRLWKPNYPNEARGLRDLGASAEQLLNCTVRVTRCDVDQVSIGELARKYAWRVIFARRKRGGVMALVDGSTRPAVGDLISMIGTAEDIQPVVAYLGTPAEEQLELDRSVFDFRRVFVSNPEVAGRRIRDLDLQGRFGALITRVRRGDIELLASGSTVLEPGDRVRVVALRERMREVSEFFGDSYRALSEVDILTFSLGLLLGLLLGQIPIPLPGGGIFRLGIAGGPLLVALVLGTMERTGRLVWTVPYSANLTLRQIGLVLFLAAIGTRAGYVFVTTLLSSSGLLLFLAGTLITCTTALLTLWIGYRWLHIPMSLLIGMLAGLQTHPAILSFTTQQTGNDLPNIGYATVYPVAMISKIILAQVLLALLL
ncbi:MAG TPA: aspartate:alanine exchanger family transporter [Roseiflexaceae bacterium]|nr:aspartate:alanine exchanger family transporter [Roseiflexaceae bacterium]